MRKQLFSVAIASLALVGAAGAAQASDVHVSLGVGAYAPAPVYVAPPVVYYPPPPRVYAAPVVVAPAPVVVYPGYPDYRVAYWHRWHRDHDH
jgi:hypothetical protein